MVYFQDILYMRYKGRSSPRFSFVGQAVRPIGLADYKFSREENYFGWLRSQSLVLIPFRKLHEYYFTFCTDLTIRG
jgi:hypothetical protein